MPLRQKTAVAATVSALMATCGSAMAQESAGPSAFRFSGFGTFGAVVTDTRDGEFLTPGQANGATEHPEFGVDSRLGIQGVYQFNQVFSGTAQILSKQNYRGDYDPGFEWAFVKAKLSPMFSVRAGRMGAPFFMISDYRDVNYANLWVRPPLETYGQVPVSNFDGADLIFQNSVGPASLSAQLWGGYSQAKLTTSEIKLKKTMGLNLTAEFDNGLTLRVGSAKTKLSIASNNLTALQNGFALTIQGLTLANSPLLPSVRALASDFALKDADATFSGVGASWDSGNWQLNGEYTHRTIDGYQGNSTGWYTSVGYRIGKVTPFAYATQLKVDGVPANALAPLGGALATQVGGVLRSTNGTAQKTWALGARWDVASSAALKAQFERVKPSSLGAGLFIVPAGATMKGQTVNVLSLSVDFVF